MSHPVPFLSVTAQATINRDAERIRQILAAWTAAGSPDPQTDGRWATRLERELDQISRRLHDEYKTGARCHTPSLVRAALDAGNLASKAVQPLDLSRIVESSVFDRDRRTPPPGSDEVHDRDTWWNVLAPIQPSTPGPSRLPEAETSTVTNPSQSAERGRQPVKATEDPGTSGVSPPHRGRQRSKKPDSSARHTSGSIRKTRSQSRGAGLKTADIDDGGEGEKSMVRKRSASVVKSRRGSRSKSRVPSEAEAMDIEEEASAKGKGRAAEWLGEGMHTTDAEGEEDQLDEDEGDEDIPATAKHAKKPLTKSGKGKEPGNAARSRKKARDGRNQHGFLLNQFFPNPCAACLKVDRPCVASRSGMCQRCKKAKTRCDRERTQATDEDPVIFGNFEQGWDLRPGFSPGATDAAVLSDSGPETRSQMKRRREEPEDDGDSSAPPTVNVTKRRRSASARSNAETEVESAIPPPSSESDSSKAPTQAGRLEIPYVVVPTAEQAKHRRKLRQAAPEHASSSLPSAEAFQALNHRVEAMERASRESESMIKALMATVEAMRQVLVQQHGPLPSPLQAGLTWRRSLPPSRSASRVGSPLAQSPLILSPDGPLTLEPVTEEVASAAQNTAVTMPSTEDVPMDSSAAVEAEQQSSGRSSYSTFSVRPRSTSGNWTPSTMHLGWGWAVGQSTGQGSSHTGHYNNDSRR